MNKDAKIYIAGHRGLVGSAIVRCLKAKGYRNLLVCGHSDLELTCQASVDKFFSEQSPEYVFLAAAKVGGIMANSTYPADFIYQNLAIQSNVIHSAFRYGVKRLIFLGSSCIYPRDCAQPIKEEYLLAGPLEQTNLAYSIAKIAGIETCRAYNRQYNTKFLSVMPTNLYGPNDNYNFQTSHALPALIRKIHEAKVALSPEVTIWGSGQPRREFLYVDDLADACLFLISLDESIYQRILDDTDAPGLLNVGYGEDLTIDELVRRINEVVGYAGEIIKDLGKPDGTPQKLLDSTRINNLGWFPSRTLREGLCLTYESFLEETLDRI